MDEYSEKGLLFHSSFSSCSKSIVTLQFLEDFKKSTCSSDDSSDSENIYIASKESLVTISSIKVQKSNKKPEDPLTDHRCSCIIT